MVDDSGSRLCRSLKNLVKIYDLRQGEARVEGSAGSCFPAMSAAAKKLRYYLRLRFMQNQIHEIHFRYSVFES